MESLQSHMILTMSHWSSGLTCLLPVTRVTGSNPLGGLMWNRDSLLLALSRYIGDPHMIDHQQGFTPPTVTRPSCRQFDSPTWSHTAFLSRFHDCYKSPFRLHNRPSRLLGGSPVESLQSHMILTMSHWSSGLTCLLPVTRVTSSNLLGGLMWNRDSPVSVVSLQTHGCRHSFLTTCVTVYILCIRYDQLLTPPPKSALWGGQEVFLYTVYFLKRNFVRPKRQQCLSF